MAKLTVIATPIGNLKDISFRALEELKKADLILCEDTRRSLKLLSYYKLQKPLLSYHQHSKINKMEKIVELLREGKNLALISDSGTPGINDPGNQLISYLLKVLPDLKIEPIPGPSALITAASIAGFNMDRFLFLGFLPKKNKRKKFLEQITKSPWPVIFYETAPRLKKTLKELARLDGEVAVFRELTKTFEKVYRGPINNVISTLESENLKGEFTVIFKRDRSKNIEIYKEPLYYKEKL